MDEILLISLKDLKTETSQTAPRENMANWIFILLLIHGFYSLDKSQIKWGSTLLS